METNEIPIADQETEEEVDLAPAEEIIKNLPDDSRSQLIPTLQKIQNAYRYLPSPAMELLSEFLNVTRAEIYLSLIHISEPTRPY